jgi:hypothetical protein
VTAMTGAETGHLGILDPDYLRRMGESEQSIAYLTSRRPESVSTLEPRRAPYTAPATETGD